MQVAQKPVITVSGGSSGIGRATALLFAAQGCTVYVLSRHSANDASVHHIPCDVCDRAAVDAAFAQIFAAEGRLDTLINCAGMGISGAVEFTEAADAQRIFAVNFFGSLNCVQAALPYLRQSRQAGQTPHIVNTSSVAAPIAIPFQAFYSATKAALNSLTLALANELRPFGIAVTAVMPGDVRTNFTAARQKSLAGQELYGKTIARSLAVMEKDEQNGMTPEYVAKRIYKAAQKRDPQPLYTVGPKYRLFVVIAKFFPAAWVNKWVGKLYS